MNNNEAKKSSEELADEALGAVSGGTDDATEQYLICIDCLRQDKSVQHCLCGDVNCSLCPSCMEDRRKKGYTVRQARR